MAEYSDPFKNQKNFKKFSEKTAILGFARHYCMKVINRGLHSEIKEKKFSFIKSILL